LHYCERGFCWSLTDNFGQSWENCPGKKGRHTWKKGKELQRSGKVKTVTRGGMGRCVKIGKWRASYKNRVGSPKRDENLAKKKLIKDPR